MNTAGSNKAHSSTDGRVDRVSFNQNPDPRELKRALAVQMVMQNYNYSKIRNILGVSAGFVSKWKYIFVEQGITGLRLSYKGSKSYLDSAQKQIVLNWLGTEELLAPLRIERVHRR